MVDDVFMYSGHASGQWLVLQRVELLFDDAFTYSSHTSRKCSMLWCAELCLMIHLRTPATSVESGLFCGVENSG